MSCSRESKVYILTANDCILLLVDVVLHVVCILFYDVLIYKNNPNSFF
jgi:hypothetical protein